MDAFCPQKGVEHALDHMCDSFNFVASGIGEWLHVGRGHSCPAGHRSHRDSGPSPSGTKNIVAIWTLAGEGEVFGMEVIGRSSQISVETYKGIVQLSGFVNSQQRIDKTSQIARSVKGVTSVKNDLIVK